jgi:hypothetical protein
MVYFGMMSTEMIRKTLGKPRDLTVFERVRRLNEELDRLGIRQPKDDHLVRRVIGSLCQRANLDSHEELHAFIR